MLNPILERVKAIGGKVFTNGDYNLNIVGIRSRDGESNRFNDELHCIYKVDGQWRDRWWNITTDPGLYWLEHPMNTAGTAAVVADRQYPGVWQIGKHRGQYTALVQTGGSIAVHRDDNRDNKVDYRPDNIVEGYFGINCHRATTRSGGSVSVDKWSAGCQVFADAKSFSAFLNICELQKSKRGFEKITYTLLNEFIACAC